MANQIAGVKDKLMAEATNEFLDKGFQNASLRSIAEAAGTSTNSIYVRFKDKDGLFREIVKQTADTFTDMYMGELDTFEQNSPDMPYDDMFDYTGERIKVLIGYIYDHFDQFKLLICCSEGTEYTNFIHKLAEFEAESTLRYIRAIENEPNSMNTLSLPLLHMVSSAYLSGFFEIVRHDMTREEADDYVVQLQKFFDAGWREIFEEVQADRG